MTMNKKVIAMILVPIMLTMSGALAFSAFTGSVNTGVSANSGTITANIGSEISGAYVRNTVLTVSGGNDGSAGGTTTATIAYVNGEVSTTYSTGSGLATVPVTGSGSQYVIYYLNVSNLAPGNWVKIEFTLQNEGSVGVIFHSPVVQTSMITFMKNNVAVPSSDQLNLSNISNNYAGTSGTNYALFNSGDQLYGLSNLTSSYGTLAATNYETAATSPQDGFAYTLDGGTGTQFTSGFGTSQEFLGYADYNLFLGLSHEAGNGYQGVTISIPILISMQSDA